MIQFLFLLEVILVFLVYIRINIYWFQKMYPPLQPYDQKIITIAKKRFSNAEPK